MTVRVNGRHLLMESPEQLRTRGKSHFAMGAAMLDGEDGRTTMHALGERQTWDPYPPARQEDAADRHAADKAVGLSAIGLGITGLLELAFALLSGSVGLLGGALHNLSDISTSLAVWLGFRAPRPASPSQPYGYERAEDLAGLGVSIAIWLSAVFAAVVRVHRKIVRA